MQNLYVFHQKTKKNEDLGHYSKLTDWLAIIAENLVFAFVWKKIARANSTAWAFCYEYQSRVDPGFYRLPEWGAVQEERYDEIVQRKGCWQVV